MSIVSRYLAVTQGNLDNHHFYLTEVLDMFPEDVLGFLLRLSRCRRPQRLSFSVRYHVAKKVSEVVQVSIR